MLAIMLNIRALMEALENKLNSHYMLIELQTGEAQLDVSALIYSNLTYEKAKKILEEKIEEYKSEFNIDDQEEETLINRWKNGVTIECTDSFSVIIEIRDMNNNFNAVSF